MPSLVLLLVQVTLVLATARAVGLLTRRMGQPVVVAEMVAGIVLGPSVLGRVAPHAWAALFPAASTPVLGVVSQVGLILFMFLVGLELDVRQLAGRAPAAATIAVSSAVVPVVLAVPLALYLHPREAPGVSLGPFVLFVGAAMSITAFPVLARILLERRLHRTRVGTLAIASAAAVDVMAACVIAFLVAMVRRGHLLGAVGTTMVAVLFGLTMVFVVRPLLSRWLPRASPDGISQNFVAVAVLLLLGASLATEIAGVGALFGAFMAGAALPKDGGFARQLAEKVEDLVLVFFLPLFFAYSGLRTELGVLGSAQAYSSCAVILAVAFLGKLGAGAAAARLSGLPWAEAGAVGSLLNARGVVEVVVLNVGLDLHLVPPGLFSMFIVMALVTTLATAPLLDVFYPRERALRDAMAKEPAQTGFTALVCVEDVAAVEPLVAVARAFAGGQPGCVHLLRPLPPDDRPSTVLAAQQPEDALAVFEGTEPDGVEVRTMSFVSQRPARDICDLADAKEASVIVLPSYGAPKAALARAMVHEVIEAASCPVAVWIGPASARAPRRVLVLGQKRLGLADCLARGLDLEPTHVDAAGVRAASPEDLLVADASECDGAAQFPGTLVLVHSPAEARPVLGRERARVSGGV
ncbi:MAG TPA: cation:proton antiporter [Polyangiaceae bacterium]|nr:cation:proton antiporter [Polyangiaceae bacterium]